MPNEEEIKKENLDQKEESSPSDPQNKGESKKNDKQLYWIIGTLAVLVAVFFLSSYIFSSLSTFEHEGLTFTKEKFGDIPVYHYYYYYTHKDEQYQYNLYLRNDPRKNSVPLTSNVINSVIEFPQTTTVYLSIDPEGEGLIGCEYASVGIASLSSFLVDNQIKVKSASPDIEVAEQNSVWHANCEKAPTPDSTVILMKGSNETKITKQTDSCYVIEISECQVLEAVESFELKALLDARARKFETI